MAHWTSNKDVYLISNLIRAKTALQGSQALMNVKVRKGSFLESAEGQVQKKWPLSVTIRVKINLFQTSFIFILPIADML